MWRRGIIIRSSIVKNHRAGDSCADAQERPPEHRLALMRCRGATARLNYD